MNINVNVAALRSALALATSVADKKNVIPALACALLRAGKSLTVAASDLSVSYVSEMPCAVKEPGAIALDAQGLFAIISSLTADEVTIRAVDGKGEIRAGKARFQLGSQRAEDFPVMPDVTALKFHGVDMTALAKMAAGVAYCVAVDLTRTNLAGVHLDFARNTAMASDGHRAALRSVLLGNGLEGEVLIPRAALATLVKAAGEEEAGLARSGGELFLKTGSTVVAVKLFEAEFPIRHEIKPSYFRVKSEHDITIGREAFIAAIKRVALVTAKDKDHAVRMSVKSGAASLASRSGGGIAEDEIPVAYDGTGCEFGFNAAYVVEGLESMQCDEVLLGVDDPLAPLVFRPAEEEMGEEHVVVVMPVRTDGGA